MSLLPHVIKSDVIQPEVSFTLDDLVLNKPRQDNRSLCYDKLINCLLPLQKNHTWYMYQLVITFAIPIQGRIGVGVGEEALRVF